MGFMYLKNFSMTLEMKPRGALNLDDLGGSVAITSKKEGKIYKNGCGLGEVANVIGVK